MPYTPFHFGPGAVIAIPFNRYIDIPAFLLVNIAVALEPLAVMTLSLSYPLHGYAHSFLVASIIGIISGLGLYRYRNITTVLMQKYLKKIYTVTRNKVVFSAILGGWFYVLLDSMVYYDIRPFFPSTSNPFLGAVSQDQMYSWCAVSFVPAFIIYYAYIIAEKKKAS